MYTEEFQDGVLYCQCSVVSCRSTFIDVAISQTGPWHRLVGDWLQNYRVWAMSCWNFLHTETVIYFERLLAFM